MGAPALADAAAPAQAPAPLVGATRRAVVWRLSLPDAGDSSETVTRFVLNVVEVAEAVSAARAQIPPPAAFMAGLDAWRRLALTLGGSLSIADMSIEGVLGGHAVEVATEWDEEGEPARTWVRVGAGGTRWPSPSPEILAATLGDTQGFVASAELLSLALPAPLLDGELALDALRRVGALAAALQPGGPFR